MSWFFIGAAVFLGIPAAAWFMQDQLLFFPQPGTAAPPAHAAVAPEEVRLAAADGTDLHGWLLRSGAAPAPLVLYYGGNAEEVSWVVDARLWPPGWSVLAMNYRGYGRSGGKPSEQALTADALAAFDAFAARPDVDRARIVVYGRSLGTGVATYVAAQRKVAGVVLVSPYDSITAVGRHHYPWLPVGLLLRHPFDSAGRAGSIDAPLVAVAAATDPVVPVEHSQRLVDAWRGPKTLTIVAGAGHDDIAARPESRAAIDSFLGRLR